VDPDLTDDQQLLRETTERFIETEYPLTRVRARAEEHGPVPAAYWSQGAELGWFSLLAPEELGGGSISGSGLLDLAILAEERGRFVQPGPFIDTNVVVTALAEHGSDEQRSSVLPALMAGEAPAAWALADPAGNWLAEAGLSCEASSDGYVLRGTKGCVVEASSAAWFLVSTVTPEGPTQFLVSADAPGVHVDELHGFDFTRTFADVRFDDVVVSHDHVVGTLGGARDSIDRQLQIADVLCVAESVGAMGQLFDVTLQYAKDRTAFGRPIGSFQAVKHQIADTSMLLELSMAASTSAARSVQEGGADAGEAISMAKAYVAESGVELAHACWQNFGGIAYTWEHDFHLYLRRLTADSALYGSAAWHRERVVSLAGL
jgi:alkylation response protein AidB-like acyl-CoA dehydrogenase